jgi:hypothetical protein
MTEEADEENMDAVLEEEEGEEQEQELEQERRPNGHTR